MTEGERGVDVGDACEVEGGATVFEDIDRFEVGIDSSRTERAPEFRPPAARSCCNCCCWTRFICKRRFYSESMTTQYSRTSI
jgi:hypothetical protein